MVGFSAPPEFHPNLEEFDDFEQYVRSISEQGLRSGCALIHPPSEWKVQTISIFFLYWSTAPLRFLSATTSHCLERRPEARTGMCDSISGLRFDSMRLESEEFTRSRSLSRHLCFRIRRHERRVFDRPGYAGAAAKYELGAFPRACGGTANGYQ